MALRGALTHRKTRRLAKLLEVPIPCALGVMEALWHVTATHTPTGAIGTLSNQDIADEMFWEGSADELVENLKTAELLDKHAVYRLVVHGWNEHADQGTRRKVARNGQLMVGDDEPATSHSKSETGDDETQLDMTRHVLPHARLEPVPVPVPDPAPEITIGMVETCRVGEPKLAAPPDEHSSNGSREKPPPPEPKAEGSSENIEQHWLQFVAAYPPRCGDTKRTVGRERFLVLIRSGVPPSEIIDGARRYRALCEATGILRSEKVQQMSTFLGRGKTWEETFEIPPTPMVRNRGAPPAMTTDEKLALSKSRYENEYGTHERS